MAKQLNSQEISRRALNRSAGLAVMDVMSPISVGNKEIIGKKLTERIRQRLMEHAANIVKSAKGNFTTKGIRTGALRNAIKPKGVIKDGRIWVGVGIDTAAKAVYKGEVVRPHKYAHLVELGFTDRAGNDVQGIGFLTKAVKANGGNEAIVKIIKKSADDTLRNEGVSK